MRPSHFPLSLVSDLDLVRTLSHLIDSANFLPLTGMMYNVFHTRLCNCVTNLPLQD